VSTGQLEYVGHSTVLVELDGARILTDPVLGHVGYVRRHAPLPELGHLRGLDAILLSHAHADHLDVRSLRRLEHAGPVFAPRGAGSILRKAGLREVIEVTEGESVAVGAVGIQVTHAEHDGRRHPLGPPIPALGYLLEGSTRVYFAGDTDLFDAMEELAGVDVALLPISGWGPRVPAGHLDPAGAARAAGLIRPGVAVPIHWGTLRRIALREDDPSAPALAFAEAAAALHPPVAVRILQPGETMEIPVNTR
jgi:L-ascorbate metabolism protein UlaG (beta-lactamase superfamily)